MTDYGRSLEFGIFPVPEADRLDEIRAQVLAAHHAGVGTRHRTFILWSEGEPVEQVHRFAEIAGTVKEIVELERRR
ncbi:MAG: hypothetical protein HKN07_14515 [Acidimicrobiia bacterium]|nr:hypothetical protein [Acidimicrobiia bacterium]